jgi:cystine transport system substrate-binding protein
MRTRLIGLLLAALLSASAALASCSPQAAPTRAPAAPTAAPAAAAPAPAAARPPTSAPAAPAPTKAVVVEKAAPQPAAQAPTVVIWTPTSVGRPISTMAGLSDWERIRTAGRLVVGLSSGYRPFAYYDDGSELDGFDIAVVREIGRRLGLTPAARDMIPGDLMEALRTRQIDLALLDPSGTPGGEGAADFTKPYHVCRDVILAAKSAAAGEVRTPAGLTGYKIGVLGGSRHEAWLRRTLIDPGLMQPSALFTFTLISPMVTALQDGRIDLAILDSVQAQPLLKQGGVRLVGLDLNRQDRSLAVPVGFDRLREEVDAALAEMARDGTLTRLTGQYLGTDLLDATTLTAATPETGVTPTPSPEPTAEPPPGSFTADPVYIAPGECSRVAWNIEGVREVYFYARGEDWEDSPATGQESRKVCPPTTTTYELRVVDDGGVTKIRSVTILVEQAAALPLAAWLTTDPESSVELGACLKLSWGVRGQPANIQLMRDQIVLWANAPAAGSMEDCPPAAGSVTYGILASAPGQTIQTQRVVTVRP